MHFSLILDKIQDISLLLPVQHKVPTLPMLKENQLKPPGLQEETDSIDIN